MPMPKFTKYDRLIMELAAEYPRAADVWRQFQSKADEEEWSDIPGERTVKRRVDEFHKLQPAEKREYSRFRWPQTMIDGALPWEASRAGLDLLRYYEDQDRGNDAWAIKEGLGVRSAGEGWERPTVGAVKWLHRV